MNSSLPACRACGGVTAHQKSCPSRDHRNGGWHYRHGWNAAITALTEWGSDPNDHREWDELLTDLRERSHDGEVTST